MRVALLCSVHFKSDCSRHYDPGIQSAAPKVHRRGTRRLRAFAAAGVTNRAQKRIAVHSLRVIGFAGDSRRTKTRHGTSGTTRLAPLNGSALNLDCSIIEECVLEYAKMLYTVCYRIIFTERL